MAFVEARGLKHQFALYDDEGEAYRYISALDGVDLSVEEGEFIAVLGRNGSGKSTFARHVNALLFPDGGTLTVDGMDATDPSKAWDIRRAAGMIFQNPDNQIVAATVEEDVAFGPENLGIPTEEICGRVSAALDAVHMGDYRQHSPNRLSGGQKQRVAIAGVLAMRPRCIIMDEPTAMLDPEGRGEVLAAAERLNREQGVTIILITHYMEEALGADRVFVMDTGRVVMQGHPREIFSQIDRLKGYGLCAPQIAELAWELKCAGLDLPAGILREDELEESLEGIIPAAFGKKKQIPGCAKTADRIDMSDCAKTAYEDPLIQLKNISYTYSPGTTYETRALSDVSLKLHKGEIAAVIGHTGSGKSTMIQLLNGLLTPSKGRVYYEGKDIFSPGFSLRRLRAKVGLIFQYPEYQLFESTLLRDVCFGPQNQGLSEEEAKERAKEAILKVGLGPAEWEMSPFELSGGQKRRAAIAGVIAMRPEVLIMDEPTAGLDPTGRRELFDMIEGLHDEWGMTILLISHDMDEVAEHVRRIIVLKDGEVICDDTPRRVFSNEDKLKRAGLSVPRITHFMHNLRREARSASVRTDAQIGRQIDVQTDGRADAQTDVRVSIQSGEWVGTQKDESECDTILTLREARDAIIRAIETC